MGFDGLVIFVVEHLHRIAKAPSTKSDRIWATDLWRRRLLSNWLVIVAMSQRPI